MPVYWLELYKLLLQLAMPVVLLVLLCSWYCLVLSRNLCIKVQQRQ